MFIIGPDKKLKLSLNYPASVGAAPCLPNAGCLHASCRILCPVLHFKALHFSAEPLSYKNVDVRCPIHRKLPREMGRDLPWLHDASHTINLLTSANAGRNMDEITRVVDALQLSARASVATPANWPNNHENIGAKGWAFLLPTVTPKACF